MFGPEVERARIAENIRRLRQEKGWSQEVLAQKVGTSQGTVARWETEQRDVSYKSFQKLCDVLGANSTELKGLAPARPRVPLNFTDNPWPMESEHITVHGAYVFYEADNKPLKWTAQYRHERLVMHSDIEPYWDRIQEHLKARASEVGAKYFPGPVVRLSHMTFSESSEEFGCLTFHLAPLSWFEFSGLHTMLDDKIFDDSPYTIRERFCDREALYGNQVDLRWCRLSNMLSVHLIPVTTDGFGLIKLRPATGNSVEPNILIAGVDENMHRFSDESEIGDQFRRRNEIVDPPTVTIDTWYRPRGIPSPYLCALRGVYEETSPKIGEAIAGSVDHIKFLSVVMDLKMFHPHLLGMVELPFSRDETRRMIADHPGKDARAEAGAHRYVALDFNDRTTKQLVADQRNWSAAGLAALVATEKYLRCRST
jgi:transcriptional regulator with XRE-family HTH domain